MDIPARTLDVVANGLTHRVIEWTAPGAVATALLIHGFMDAGATWDEVAKGLDVKVTPAAFTGRSDPQLPVQVREELSAVLRERWLEWVSLSTKLNDMKDESKRAVFYSQFIPTILSGRRRRRRRRNEVHLSERISYIYT